MISLSLSLSLSSLSILNSFVVGFLWSPVVIVYKLSSWWSVQWPTKKYVQIDSQWNYTDLNNLLLLLLLLLQRIPKMKKNNIRSQNLWNHFFSVTPKRKENTHTHNTVLIIWNFEYIIIIRSQLLLIRKNPVLMRFYILISLMCFAKLMHCCSLSFCLLSKLLYNMFYKTSCEQ